MSHDIEAITLLVQRVTKLETLAERAAEDRKDTTQSEGSFDFHGKQAPIVKHRQDLNQYTHVN